MEPVNALAALCVLPGAEQGGMSLCQRELTGRRRRVQQVQSGRGHAVVGRGATYWAAADAGGHARRRISYQRTYARFASLYQLTLLRLRSSRHY